MSSIFRKLYVVIYRLLNADGNSSHRTHVFAFTALNTFSVSDFIDVHSTLPYTLSTMRAFMLVNFDAKNGNFVKERIKCAQRADKPAKEAKDKNRCDDNDRRQQKFP